MGTSEEYLRARICPECHVAIMELDKQHIYVRCPICGYTEIDKLVKTPEQIKNSKITNK